MCKVRVLILISLLLAGCITQHELEPRPAGNPRQIDLSGQWVLLGGQALPDSGEATIRIPPPVSRVSRNTQQPRRSSRSRRGGSSLHVFVEAGQALKITQTDYGLFISFDRAVVEEYNFGEKRIVNVGPIEAQRVSGWVEKVFIIETMDAKGNLLTESWRLGEDGETLVRDIVIVEDQEPAWSSQQRFDRE